jgi:hypothetical protein
MAFPFHGERHHIEREIGMNRAMRAALASFAALSIFASGACASDKDKGPSTERQKIDRNMTGSIPTASLMTGDIVAAWQAGKINVVAVSTLNDVDPNKTMLLHRRKTNPDEVAALQAAVQNNTALKSQLQLQNVQLQNIVAAVLSADGTVTFYVK